MGVKLNLDEIANRKINTKKKASSSQSRNGDKVKKNEIIEIPIYPEDDRMMRAFKNFINEQKTTLQKMDESGFFKETEAYNIIYNLKRPYITIEKNGKVKKTKPQFSWVRAEKLLDFFGYDIEFVFHPINEE